MTPQSQSVGVNRPAGPGPHWGFGPRPEQGRTWRARVRKRSVLARNRRDRAGAGDL